MTGRELILYILENNLENEPVVNDGRFIGFLTLSEVANRLDVGIHTINAWIALGRIPAITLHGKIYIPANFEQNANKMEGSKNV